MGWFEPMKNFEIFQIFWNDLTNNELYANARKYLTSKNSRLMDEFSLWVPALTKGIFTHGATTTQRAESIC